MTYIFYLYFVSCTNFIVMHEKSYNIINILPNVLNKIIFNKYSIVIRVLH